MDINAKDWSENTVYKKNDTVKFNIPLSEAGNNIDTEVVSGNSSLHPFININS